MSNSNRRMTIPSFEIPVPWLNNLSELAHLAVELTLLLVTLDTIISDVVQFTNPHIPEVSKVWQDGK